jgi:hypothetical protein
MQECISQIPNYIQIKFPPWQKLFINWHVHDVKDSRSKEPKMDKFTYQMSTMIQEKLNKPFVFLRTYLQEILNTDSGQNVTKPTYCSTLKRIA